MFKEIKELVAGVQRLQGQVKSLQQGITRLQAATATASHFVDEIQQAVNKWQFKNQPRLARISKIIDRLNQDK